MSSLYLGYCLENEFNKKHDFFSKLGVFLLTSGDVIYHQPNAGDLGAILGASASIRGYIQQKQPDFRCVFY